jgi:hypothetical protein
MSPQKVLYLNQDVQSSQGGFVREVLFPRCVFLKPSPPILLPLATHSPKPPSQCDLLEETQKNGKPDHLKPTIIELGPERMDCSTVGTTISLEQQGSRKIIKITRDITMSPESWALASRTPGWTGPGVLLPLLLKKIDIDGKIQYQKICLGG